MSFVVMRHCPSAICFVVVVVGSLAGCGTSRAPVLQGADAAEVLKTMGQPDIWGNVDDENPPGGCFSFDTSWMTTGRCAPQEIPGQMAWLYHPKDRDPFDGPVTIVLFKNKKVTRVVQGTLDGIYDP